MIDFQPFSGWVNIRCPLCDDRKKHGGINPQGYYHCWKCGGHELVYLVQRLLHIHKDEAEQIINSYDTHSQIVSAKKAKQKHQSKIVQPGDTLQASHRKYLATRGFKPSEIVRDYKVTGTIHSPREYKLRLVVPIYHNKRLVSFHARDITGEQALRWKVLSPEESVVHFKHTLYASDYSDSSQVGVVEGICDQWRMGKGFVATYGTALTSQQLKLLSFYDRVFFLFDPGAQDKANKYAKLLAGLKSNIQVEVIDLELPEESDPAELTESEAKNIRNELGFI